MTTNSSSPRDARTALLAAAREELHEKGESSVSLRAVARRAGLSHAAPAHFFGGRPGLLTAVAVDGFAALTARLDEAAAAAGDSSMLAALGRAYVDFGAEHPALIDLMFRGTDLLAGDDTLLAARRACIGRLVAAVGETRGGDDAGSSWTLISWALVHGLVVLEREGMVAPVAGRPPAAGLTVAHELIELYSAHIAPARD